MKNVFLIAGILIAAATAGADVSDGLIAYYPMNGNADDESGNGAHGTVIGALLTSGITGTPETAYTFNGSSDYITSSPSLPAGQSPRTVSAWFRTSSVTGTGGWYHNTVFSYGTRSASRLYTVAVCKR